MSSLLRRVEKLEDQSSGIGAMIWQNMNETREQALARYERAHPGVLGLADSVMVCRWVLADEGSGV